MKKNIHASQNTQPKAFHLLARKVLLGFLCTFIVLRVLVYVIMANQLTSFYVFVDNLHVHHFNEGIIMLALISGYMILGSPSEKAIQIMALVYGIALGLTFDEYGMLLELNMKYWQPASFVAVTLITTVLALAATIPSLKKFNKGQLFLLVILIFAFFVALRETGTYIRTNDAKKLDYLTAPSSLTR